MLLIVYGTPIVKKRKKYPEKNRKLQERITKLVYWMHWIQLKIEQTLNQPVWDHFI